MRNFSSLVTSHTQTHSRCIKLPCFISFNAFFRFSLLFDQILFIFAFVACLYHFICVCVYACMRAIFSHISIHVNRIRTKLAFTKFFSFFHINVWLFFPSAPVIIRFLCLFFLTNFISFLSACSQSMCIASSYMYGKCCKTHHFG